MLNTINGVTIGDKFKEGRHNKAEVVDILEKRSLKTGEIVGYECLARMITGMATNTYPVPFSTVVRNRLE